MDANGNYYVSPECTRAEWYGYRYGTKAEADRLGFKQVFLDLEPKKIMGFPGIKERFITFLGKEVQSLSSKDVNQLFELFITPGMWLDRTRVNEAFRLKLNSTLGIVFTKFKHEVEKIRNKSKQERKKSKKELVELSENEFELRTLPSIRYSSPISQNYSPRRKPSLPNNMPVEIDIEQTAEEKNLICRYSS